MARKMDKYADLIAEFDQASREYTKSGRDYRRAEERKKTAEAKLLKAMGTSSIGTLNGIDTLETYIDERRSATIDRVKEFAPDKFHDIVLTSRKTKVRFIEGVRQ